jgi:hypothetical protein
MKKLIAILAIVACATIAQAQSNNPLFAPFYDSMRIAAAMKMAQPQPQQNVIRETYTSRQLEPIPETQYVYTEDGHLIMFIPTGPGTFHTFKAW